MFYVYAGHKLWIFTDHKSFVQGVAFDPQEQFMATMSCDRYSSILLFNLNGSERWSYTSQSAHLPRITVYMFVFTIVDLYCRICRIYHFKSRTLSQSVSKLTIPNANNNVDEKPKAFKMFLDDSLKSFFRRLAFSPDGNLLVVPAGCLEKGQGEKNNNVTYVFKRTNFSKYVF